MLFIENATELNYLMERKELERITTIEEISLGAVREKGHLEWTSSGLVRSVLLYLSGDSVSERFV